MSSGEDSSFCHYCGRKAGLERELHWDHVPALNVKIPHEYLQYIKKTLIRACSECNLMASDRPHMEYIDRHIWLKNAYLEKYKRLILSGKHQKLVYKDNDLLAAYINNSIIRYEEILYAIGFGLVDLSQITSDVLNMKDDDGNYISDVINKHLSLPIFEDEPDIKNKIIPSLDSFFSILFLDFDGDGENISKKNYDEMYRKYGYIVDEMILPSDPDFEYNLSWDEIRKIIEHMKYYNEEERNYSIQDIISFLNKQDENYITYNEFIGELVNVMENRIKKPNSLDIYDFRNEKDFELWYQKHKSLLDQLGVPGLPCRIYKKEWENITKDINALLSLDCLDDDFNKPDHIELNKEVKDIDSKFLLGREASNINKQYEVKIENIKSSPIEKEKQIKESHTQKYNWANYFEKNIKSQLPKNSIISKSYIEDDGKTIFGNLIRFNVKVRNSEVTIDCYDNGSVSIKIYDFLKKAQVFSSYLPINDKKKIEISFNLLIDITNFQIK